MLPLELSLRFLKQLHYQNAGYNKIEQNRTKNEVELDQTKSVGLLFDWFGNRTYRTGTFRGVRLPNSIEPIEPNRRD